MNIDTLFKRAACLTQRGMYRRAIYIYNEITRDSGSTEAKRSEAMRLAASITAKMTNKAVDQAKQKEVDRLTARREMMERRAEVEKDKPVQRPGDAFKASMTMHRKRNAGQQATQ